MGSGHFQVLPTVLSERGKWAEVLHAGSNTHQNFPFYVVACTSWPQRSVDKGEQWFHISVFLFLKFLWKILCSTSLSVQALGNYRQVCVGEENTPQNLSVGDCFLYFPWLALAFFSKLSSGKCVECSWGMSWTPSIRVSDGGNYMRAARNFSEPCSGAKGLLGQEVKSQLCYWWSWGWGRGLNKTKARSNHPSFCKTLQDIQNSVGLHVNAEQEKCILQC